MKHLIVIDMQKDFCTGTLANKDAVAVIPHIKNLIESGNFDNVYFTRDSHGANYLETQEGKHLPVEHCIVDTDGWQVIPELVEAARKRFGDDGVLFINKTHFGFDNWNAFIRKGDEVTICGTVTSICVASNALAIKMIEGVEVNVVADCCADLAKESHEAALTTMKMCQCNIE